MLVENLVHRLTKRPIDPEIAEIIQNLPQGGKVKLPKPPRFKDEEIDPIGESWIRSGTIQEIGDMFLISGADAQDLYDETHNKRVNLDGRLVLSNGLPFEIALERRMERLTQRFAGTLIWPLSFRLEERNRLIGMDWIMAISDKIRSFYLIDRDSNYYNSEYIASDGTRRWVQRTIFPPPLYVSRGFGRRHTHSDCGAIYSELAKLGTEIKDKSLQPRDIEKAYKVFWQTALAINGIATARYFEFEVKDRINDTYTRWDCDIANEFRDEREIPFIRFHYRRYDENGSSRSVYAFNLDGTAKFQVRPLLT